MSNTMQSIVNMFRYGGLSGSSWKQVKPLVRDANYRNYKIIAPLATILFVALFISDVGMGVVSLFMISQIVMMLALLAISILINLKWTSRSGLLMPAIYFMNITLLLFAVVLGVYQNPKHYAVTFMVLIIALPLITLDRPICLAIMTVAVNCVFIVLCIFYKDPAIVNKEIANSIFFMLMSLFLNMRLNTFRIKSYLMRYEKVESSWIDPLTGSKNYYAYAKFKTEIDEMILNGTDEEFAIAVCDINDLTQVNNSEGHEKGDEYLIRNCRTICQIFKNSTVYRSGGDEFVVYIKGDDYDRREKLLDECLSEVSKDSFGITASGVSNFAIGMAAYDRYEHKGYVDLFRQAEQAMRDCKLNMKKEHRTAVENEVSSAVSVKKTILTINYAGDDLELLLEDKYNIIKAANEQIGIEQLKEKYNRIALVIINALGEGFACNDFLSAKKNNLIINNIPVLVLADRDVNEELCLVLGAKDFVRKPYQANVLISRVDNLIGFRESSAILSAIEFDSLTGLYTKEAFFHYAEQKLKEYPEGRFSIIISDIDDFKSINEMYGMEIGDNVLKETADFIRQGRNTGMISGRYGNDQFVSIVPNMPEVTDQALEDIYGMLMEKSLYKNLKINVKFGIYDDIEKDVDISVLCDRAMMALKTIKHTFGKYYARYDHVILEAQERKFQIEQSMQDAYDNDMFKVYYQPKHDTNTGKLVGAEALIRWVHPTYGFMPPNEFIPLFEKNGFIVYADYYVWRRTCQNLSRWKNQGLGVVPISVNASKRDFEYEDFLDTIRRPVNEEALATDLLHIEVTESIFANDMEAMKRRLDECREAGFKIELDDFGSGYSSLNTLGVLPIDVLKLDMNFLKDSKDTKKAMILAATIDLAHKLGLKIVAEGVETEEQLDELKKLECDSVQGYFFSKPLPEEEFEKYLIRFGK